MSSNRRAFLKGLGATALGIPLLRGLLGRAAHATTGTATTRFVLLFTGNGQLPSHWLPSGTGAGFGLSPVLQPLAGLEHKLLLLRGFQGGSTHSVGMSETTTGRPALDGNGVPTGGPSIDQFFANHWAGDTPLHSLELGVMPAADPYDHIVYSESGLPIPPVGSGLGGFERVFAYANEDPAVAEARRAAKGSVLDVFARDLTDLQRKLDPSTRRLLDEHLTLVRSQEQELLQPYIPVTCEAPPTPTGTELVDTWNAHNESIVAAFRCGVTRVATLRVGGWGGIESGGYDEIGVAAGHHDVAHGGSDDPDGNLLAINRFHSEQLGDLLRKLDAVPEAGGSLLDHTVVVWVNEFGLGAFNHHSRSDLQVVMAGGSSVGMANGTYREVAGVDYAHFLLSLTHLLGFPSTATFGDRGTEVVPELWA